MVVKLPRAAGAREVRWAHLLCGPVDAGSSARVGAAAQTTDAGLEDRVKNLECEVRQLRAAVQKLCAELGLDGADGADGEDAAQGLSRPGQDANERTC